MKNCYHILHLDDVPLDAQLVELTLEAARDELCTTLTHVSTKGEYLAALDRGDIDIILSDYRMPGFDGDEALKAALEKRPEIPFIMVTGELGEERVIETLQRGATDYVLKNRIFRLVPAIKRALAEAESRKRNRDMEEALRKSEERFRLIADTMPVMVWTADAQGIVTYGNHHSREYAGIPQPVPGGPPSETPVHPDDVTPTQEAWRRSLATGEPYKIEHRLRRADGAYRWHLSRAVPVRDSNGTIIKWYGTATEIHEIREAHQELERRVQERTDQLAAANRELEAFTSSVSHDLKSPLRVMEAFCTMLDSHAGGVFGTEEQKMIQGIFQNIKRMDNLISGLLQFSRLAHAPLMLAPVNMKSLARGVMEEQQMALGQDPGSVQVVIRDLPTVLADPTLMRQVLANLFSNALKFSRKVTSPRIEIGADVRDGSWLFYVRDNGVGFARDQASKLFRVFQRLHPATLFEGTGVGLANVKRIIERHGGQVCADGEEGRGAAFYFSLPALAEAHAAPGK